MGESIPALFEMSKEKFNTRPAIEYFCLQKRQWITKNFVEINEDVDKAFLSLSSLDLSPQSRVGILSSTRPEWVVADIAIMKNLFVSVPIYQSNLSEQILYTIKDADIQVIFVENFFQLEKLRAVQKKTTLLKKIVLFDKINENLYPNEILWCDFLDLKVQPIPLPIIEKDSLASIVYTSGTTGEPKGAMITHDNLLYEAHVIDQLGVLSKEDVQLLFLPLAHIFARVLMVAWIRTGHLLCFSQGPDRVLDDMLQVRPTFMAAVPRLYEKVHSKVIQTAMEAGLLKRVLACFAFRQVKTISENYALPGYKLFLAQKLVFKKIGKTLKKKMGGRLRFFVSGGAPLSAEIATFFQLCGITICEGYGLSETTAATCLNLPWSLKIGTVGKPVPGTLVKTAKDGEILVKGRGVFKGFWQKPEETKDVFTKDGWFKTGDIGQIDADGFVKIIDRKKDIIVTSQGKNIAPQMLENLIKSLSPIIAHVVIIGDKKPYLTALISLDKPESLKLLKKEKDESLIKIVRERKIQDDVKKTMDTANKELASFEQIKRFHIINKEFTVGDELTPTLKVKRKVCQEKYHREIKLLYA